MKRLTLVFLAGLVISLTGASLYTAAVPFADTFYQATSNDDCPPHLETGGDTFSGCEARLIAPDLCVRNEMIASVTVSQKLKKQVRNGKKACRFVSWEAGQNTSIRSDARQTIPLNEDGSSTMQALVKPEEVTASGTKGTVTAQLLNENGEECSCGSATDVFDISGEVSELHLVTDTPTDTNKTETAETKNGGTDGPEDAVNMDVGQSATLSVYFNRSTFCDVDLGIADSEKSDGLTFEKTTLSTADPVQQPAKARRTSTRITARRPGTYQVQVEERCPSFDESGERREARTGGCTAGDDTLTIKVGGSLTDVSDLTLVGNPSTGATIPEAVEESKGGFVEVSRGSQGTSHAAAGKASFSKKSGDDTGGASGGPQEQATADATQSSEPFTLMPLVLNKTDEAGPDARKRRLTYTSEALRIWKNKDRTGPVPRNGAKGAEFSAGRTIRLYVEAVEEVERAEIRLESQIFEGREFQPQDRVRITSYTVDGPLQVIAGTKTTYEASMTGEWTVTQGGELDGKGSGKNATIAWDEDAEEGKFTFRPDRAPDENQALKRTVQIFQLQVHLPRYLVDTGSVSDPAPYMFRPGSVGVGSKGGENNLKRPVDIVLTVQNDPLDNKKNAVLASAKEPNAGGTSLQLTIPKSGAQTFYLRGVDTSEQKQDTKVSVAPADSEADGAQDRTTVVSLKAKKFRIPIFSLGPSSGFEDDPFAKEIGLPDWKGLRPPSDQASKEFGTIRSLDKPGGEAKEVGVRKFRGKNIRMTIL